MAAAAYSENGQRLYKDSSQLCKTDENLFLAVKKLAYFVSESSLIKGLLILCSSSCLFFLLVKCNKYI